MSIDDPLVNDDLIEQRRYRESMDPVIPSNFNTLRCCKICGLIKSQEQFQRDGCDNCKRYFDNWEDYVSSNFTGMLSLLRPDRSFIGKVLGMKDTYVCGLYAASCEDSVSPEIESTATVNDIQVFCLRK
ncbi:transcription initiation protein SPT4, putative [Entamoeba histolytica HM-3:IMSS]|uniref:Transcription initiation protein SPT4, putative n=5 Tax=Entamoeba histolytica TaxID=5759 RepID=C4LT05_ENTH1|nr:transcription initiation protein SPT4, putative [Entamoeba histolytica HM-1:IMSS]EMD42838.1 transcription initiation protein SPT4, putative [Entamoeba histolytica KU27]EMS16864.1 transcription initiation protein SPT4, putative [Entamoeba histolytica HM-3:IMSS]ENY59745.1 transcription initiation protein SPT4, putative [Entamoeba histolytica HM-1:IMSS-A]GAT91673.1 transcription initiation protein spt4 putative [Entamoeba histolytica]EAL52115.1 transcription initiation protein SPT4, putative [|eukprot:XP_657505.1 transcription initiation protein SPT4, putative [Entamoeba histolytica HM-1:IMSS]